MAGTKVNNANNEKEKAELSIVKERTSTIRAHVEEVLEGDS